MVRAIEHRGRLRLVEVLEGDDDRIEELVHLIRLLLCPLHTVKIDNRSAELLVVDLPDAVLSRELAEPLEVSLNGDARGPRLQNEFIHVLVEGEL